MTKERAQQVAIDVLREHGVTPSQWKFSDRPVRIECLVDDPRGGKKRLNLPVKRSWSEQLFRESVTNQVRGVTA